MNEGEARDIAQKYVAEKSFDKCFIASVRKLGSTENPVSATNGYEWLIQFQFENDGSYATEYLYILVDDATCEPWPLDCL